MERKLFLIRKLNYQTLFWGLLSLVLVLTLTFGLSGYLYFSKAFPQVSILKGHYPHIRYQGKGQKPKVAILPQKPKQWISYSQISRSALGAVVVSEDWAFFQHSGFDTQQIKEAIKEDLEKGKFSRGASTITQQVIKNVFLTSEKSIWRKIKELILAVELEQSVPKRRILEVYFNIAEWGEGIFGIHQAAYFYFGKPPSSLTSEEGAFLAMLLPSPIRYSQSFRKKSLTPYAKKTIRSILNKMEQAQYISNTEKIRAQNACLSFLQCEPIQESQKPSEINSENAPHQTPNEKDEELDVNEPVD